MADAFEMGEHRHRGFGLDAADQAAPAARHDEIDGTVEALEHQPDSRAIGGGHKLHGIRGQAGALQPLAQSRRRSPRGTGRLSEPPRRMAALPDLMHSAPASAVTLGRLS